MRKVNSTIGVTAALIMAMSLAAGNTGKPGAGPQNNNSGRYLVNIDNFSFGPATLTVPVGTRVTWTNHDDIPHNVVSVDKKFASPVLDTDEQFSYTFNTRGTYEYYCSIHPKMTGKVVVQ